MIYITRNCLYCGIEFKTTRGKINAGKGKYCSHRHFILHRTQLSKENLMCGKKHGKKFWSDGDSRWKVVWYDLNGNPHQMFYAKWWWEQNVGNVPDGCIIVPIDGNYSNISDDNFECITLGENQRRNFTGYERTDEYKNKLRTLKLGKKMSEEHKRKTGEATRLHWASGVFDKVHCGEHSHRWRGGQSKSYPEEFFEIREFIVERDRNTCRVCGWKVTERKKGHVHHRDGNREHNDQDNLLFLCYLCHGKIHSKSEEIPEIMALRSELYWE